MAHQPMKVLAVDDEPVNLRVLTMILQSSGYRTLAVSTGQACLEAARRERPDIILLDVMLPDLLGYEVSRRIKLEPDLADIYIILISEKRVALDDVVEGIMGGADAYLARPFTREELLAYVTSGARARRLIARLKEETARRERAENEQQLARQREMLQKDLHDGIGGITTNIALLAEVGKRAATPEQMRDVLETIGRLAREGMHELRGVMNALERRDVSWVDLVAEMRRFGTTMLEPHELVLRVCGPAGSASEEAVDLYLYSNLLGIFKEAVANVVKHARATTLTLSVTVESDVFSLRIVDDGVGLPASPRSGRGLANMAARARNVGASLEMHRTGDGLGTEIVVEVPLPPRYPALGERFRSEP